VVLTISAAGPQVQVQSVCKFVYPGNCRRHQQLLSAVRWRLPLLLLRATSNIFHILRESVLRTTNMAEKRVPLDVEALMRAADAKKLALSKPRLILPAERARLKAQKEAKEAEERKAKEQAKLRARKEKESLESGSVNGANNDRYNGNHDELHDGRRDHRLQQGPAVPTGPRAMRQGSGHTNGNFGNGASHANGQRDRAEPRQEKNSEAKSMSRKRTIQEVEDAERLARYMGPQLGQSKFSANKKQRRATGKQFTFDWDQSEDTTKDFGTAAASDLFLALQRQWEGVDDNILHQAEGIIKHDPENGVDRAKKHIEKWKAEQAYLNRSAQHMHWSEKRLEDMKERDWRIFKEDFGIATKGGAIPNPIRSWQESPLPRDILDIVASVGYEEPTPVQRAAIPIAMQARDLIGVAVTGSGKTAAFLLPLLVYISKLPPLTDLNKGDGPYALILAPTRELVQQIETEARKFATPMGLTVVSIVGGHSLEEQAFALRNGAEIIVATPGRLLDCIERRLLVFTQCCYVIMDEADRMIDLGFEEPVNKILEALPVTNEKPDTDDAENAQLMSQYLGSRDRYRQTMMYTATMPSSVEKIAKKYLRRPAIVTIGNVGEAVETVEQRVEFVGGEDKRKKRLQEILQSQQFAPPIIVFVNIKRNCDTVARDIRHMGFSSVTLHGSKTQQQREEALASLREGKTDVLVATDLAGRGIDVPDVSLVVNFNMATSIESYTHRIGRTGRAGKSGVAITFLGNEDADVLYDLKQMISKSSISKVPEDLRRHEAAQRKPTKAGAVGRREDIATTMYGRQR
jgi:ATP-dependent RNA helicase DDX23/PRP28